MRTVQFINLARRMAVLDDGRAVPITDMLDDEGQHTDDVTEAFAFVCGEGEIWHVHQVSEFERQVLQ